MSLKKINVMTVAPDGWNFVGTRDGGVVRLYHDVNGITGASPYSTEWSGLLTDHINDIFITSNGNQWYATNKGVAFHAGFETKKNWETYTEFSSDLPSNIVYSVAVDQKGMIWIGTDKGITSFDGINWLWFPFVNGISDYSVFDLDCDIDGSLWFASDIGLIHYDENETIDGTDMNHIRQNLTLNVFPTIAKEKVTIMYDAPSNNMLSLLVLDINGRIIQRLDENNSDFGPYSFTWNINSTTDQQLEGPFIIMLKTEKEFISKMIIVTK